MSKYPYFRKTTTDDGELCYFAGLSVRKSMMLMPKGDGTMSIRIRDGEYRHINVEVITAEHFKSVCTQAMATFTNAVDGYMMDNGLGDSKVAPAIVIMKPRDQYGVEGKFIGCGSEDYCEWLSRCNPGSVVKKHRIEGSFYWEVLADGVSVYSSAERDVKRVAKYWRSMSHGIVEFTCRERIDR